ncbi:MAG: hypothetical protein VYE40_03410 [Myxococcota bacterium]|jgi:uncharacterized membrane protein YebE (DUF533 family)|nr:hypothetical protein [Myxococcota bacterium]MEC9440133.1 hypothetical protein [Myxococcota bacterium]
MVEDLKKTCVQCVLAVAWADNEMNKVERDFLVGLIERAGFGSAAREELMAWLDEPPPEPNWSHLSENPELGEDILRQALILACMDMTVTAKEMSFLHRLREHIGMDELVFYRVQRDVEEIIAKQLQGSQG